jgi:hypothetical protein
MSNDSCFAAKTGTVDRLSGENPMKCKMAENLFFWEIFSHFIS